MAMIDVPDIDSMVTILVDAPNKETAQHYGRVAVEKAGYEWGGYVVAYKHILNTVDGAWADDAPEYVVEATVE